MHKTPCTIMRGGTSKGVFFRLEDMPEDQSAWPDFLLDVMGSPDDRQIDGLGGANSLTSKVAIIKASDDPAYDVEYTFAQVSIGTRLVDFQGNCGNISSAVGPYAVNTGLVPAVAPVTTVRIHNTNTDKLIVAEVAVEDGRAKTHGNARIPGVPGTGSPVYLSFYDSGGAVTGKLLPTGNAVDSIETSMGSMDISIVDSANPLVFIRAEDVGLGGTELPADYTADDLKRLEEIRSIAAEMCGLCDRERATKESPAVPKTTIIAGPKAYADINGIAREKKDMDLCVRMMSMQKPHNAVAVTGAVCIAAAAATKGTLVHRITGDGKGIVRIGHPGGIMEAAATVVSGEVQCVRVLRTARRIMEGNVYTKRQ